MNLPAEVIQHIFSLLSPREIVRLRQVSKQFRDIAHDSTLWREVYLDAGLLRPSGPFSWQSTQCLERTLVQSELVSKTWTSQPLKELSHTLTTWKRERLISWTVLLGRWCIFLQGKTIQCHDIDTNTHHLLYDGTAHPEFGFTASTITLVNGKRLYLLLVDHNHPHEFMKMLEFVVNSDGFSQPRVMNWDHIRSHSLDTWSSMDDGHGSSPFLIFRRRQPCMVLDLHTRSLYILPVPKHPIDLANELQFHPTFPEYWRNPSTQFVLTRTHVIVVHVYGWSSDMHALVQAFVVPESTKRLDRTPVSELRLTHEVAIPIALPSFSLLRNSKVHPLTGSVNIRLFLITPNFLIGGAQNHMSCLDLNLPKPVSTTEVLPISIRSQHLFESRWTLERYTASDDGYARGFLLVKPGSSGVSARKFSIDASGEECTIAVSDPCPVEWPEDRGDIAFDGTRGRVHYFKIVPHVNQIVTVDLA